MSDAARTFLALGGAAALALLTIPLARALALRTEFLDHPRDYKEHSAPTPYLGGLGLMAAFAAMAVLLGLAFPHFTTIMLLTALLLAVGTLDDRVGLGPGLRFGVQIFAGLVLWAQDVRWEPFDFALLNLLITLLWVTGLTNAFNLLDNIDGAAATTGAFSAIGLGVIALEAGAGEIAAIAFALAGACLAFLIFNFSRSRKVFLGDGGSLPLGFLVAALTLGVPMGVGDQAVLVAVPLVGIAIFDTTLVVVSRYRRGAGILTGARDHSTHRLLAVLGTPLRVAAVLALTQGLLAAFALWMSEMSDPEIYLASTAYVALGFLMLALFEGPILSLRAGEQPA